MTKKTVGIPEGDPWEKWMNPPAEFRPAVLWSWNGTLTRPRITSMLEGFATHGIGGVFIHPRPGLVTEYLSKEWFDLWGFALAECRRLGLGCHIYDENSFPSGFGGGHVLAANPLAANSRLAARHLPEGSASGELGDCLLLATLEVEDGGSKNRMELVLEKVRSRLWHGGFPMADVCRSEVTRAFLASTLDRYNAELGQAMHGFTTYVFTDEPETGTGAKGFHLSEAFLHAFRTEHGYALESEIAALVGDQPASPSVRHDYHATLNRLFTQNFARLNGEWCENHGLRFTGHFNEGAWPLPTGSPSTMAAQRWMQTPGLDLLGFQFQPGPLAEAALWLFTVKEATSIAAQCGRGEVLCESCGGAGYDYGPAQMKPLEDFLLALGVNRLAPHLSHQTLSGTRKYDWPQTITDHSPWWDAYSIQATHTARVVAALSTGTRSAGTLVLNPTTTGWIHYRPEAYLPPGEKQPTPLDALRRNYPAFLAALYGAQIDFDLGDESVMAELGSIEGKALRIGEQLYETVVVPTGMENMLETTAVLLSKFLKAGGTVFCAGDSPRFLNGRTADCVPASHPNWIATGAGTIQALRDKHPPLLSSPDGKTLPEDLLWAHRRTPEGAVVFLANPTCGKMVAHLACEGTSIEECDTRTGDIHTAVDTVTSNGKVSMAVELAPGEHALWRVSRSTDVPVAVASAHWHPSELRFESCKPEEPNVLPLDYCDYEGPGISLRGAHTIHADAANWRAQGFNRNLWSVSIQYRRTFVDAAILEPSGFSVRYPFEIEASFGGSSQAAALQVAVERPWLYDIFCNGVPLTQDGAAAWFDEETRLLTLGHAVRTGSNVLELRAAKFHVLAEIMPIILRGDFSTRATNRGFVLAASAPWQNGIDWASEGYGFYPWRARYRYAFSLPAASRLSVNLPDFKGSALAVQIDGRAPEWDYLPRRNIELPGVFAPGDHHFDLLLCGNLKNLMGPHFSDGLPGAWSWQASPTAPPCGGDYRLQRTGLDSPPRLFSLPT